MQAKLNVTLKRFAQGKDDGIDLRLASGGNDIIVQVKHYWNSSISTLIKSLKAELEKVKLLQPKQYYLCCSCTLTPNKTTEIFNLFSSYINSEANIITLNEIEGFLQEPQNRTILEKHFKLWLDSSGVLENITNKAVFLDCESLLSGINERINIFVKTTAFEKALKCLERCRTLFIIGEPGSGKTITSQMLLLHFASRGYRVRYTTDSTNLSVLKQSLSSDPTIKEVILLDDCLGQAYFQMKESQSTELLALIKYVHLSDNKYLILNSRVTIYKEAKERKPELITSLDRKEYKTYLLNMSEISLFEKAKMLYNHLYFSEISHEYYLAIKSGRKYRKIIEHKNYNPRIIEFISCPTLISNVPPEMYFKFIMGKLDDPQDIWKDEYERKLLTVDRIFLLTLYSLTDTSTKMSELKTCFDFWVQREKSIDSTIDQFESALKRLQGSFIKVIDMMGIKHISVVNPSVNDYLSALIHNNPSIQKTILNNACSLNQFAKMLTSDEFAEFSEKMIVSEGALTLVYETDFQRNAFFATYIPKYHIQNEKYTNYLHSFLWSPTFLMITHQVFLNKFSILEQLLTTENIIFYNLKNVLSSNNLRKILENEVFGNLIDYVRLLSPIFTDSKRDTYLQISSSIIKEAIESLCEDVNAGDCDYDVGKAMHSLMLQHISIDEDESILLDGIEEYIEADIEANTIIDIQNRICCLPEDIQERIKFDDQRSINVHGARRIAESYLAEINFDEDLIERGEQWDEIDSLFHRN